MSATLLIYDPTAPATPRSETGRPRLSGLAGKTVGFIDNAMPNFNYLVDDLAELLVSRFSCDAAVKRGKRGPSMPAAESIIDELVSRCDLVITGSGD